MPTIGDSGRVSARAKRAVLGGNRAANSGGNQGGGFYIAVMNAETVNAIVGSVAKELKTNTNSQIRQAAKDIAKNVLKPALDDAKKNAPLKLAAHMEVRPKTDRLVAVQIGSVNPKGLKGFQRNKKGSRYARSVLAWGSEMGPKGGRRKPTKPGQSRPQGPINHYGVPRNEKGYWVQPTVNRKMPVIVDAYNTAIWDIWQWAIASNRVRAIRTAAGTAPSRRAA